MCHARWVFENTESSRFNGSVKLPGALVTVLGADGGALSQQAAGEDGRFTIPDLPAARYRVRASLDGFQPVEAAAVVAAGGVVTLTLDLPIATVSDTVEVVARAPTRTPPHWQAPRPSATRRPSCWRRVRGSSRPFACSPASSAVPHSCAIRALARFSRRFRRARGHLRAR
jgi:hypothetical protein